MKYNGASIDDEMVVVNTFEQLGELLNKRMKPFYPDGDEEGWKRWANKFSSLDLAKRAATHMYNRKLAEG